MHDILTRFAVSLESLVQNWRSHSAEFKLVREDIREFISKGNGITEAGS